MRHDFRTNEVYKQMNAMLNKIINIAIIEKNIIFCVQQIDLKFTREYFSQICSIFSSFLINIHLMVENETSPLKWIYNFENFKREPCCFTTSQFSMHRLL